MTEKVSLLISKLRNLSLLFKDLCLLSGSLNSLECLAKKSLGSVTATFAGP